MAIIGRRAAIAAFLALSCIGAAVGCAPVVDVPDQEPDLAAPSDEPADLGVEDGGDLGDLADEAPPQGMEPEGGALAVRLDSYLDDNASRTGVPGVAVAVVDASGVRYLRTLGDCPDAEALFTMGSLSKSLTALSVIQLVAAGEVDLDAPAAVYVPPDGAPP
ncbi:MAG: serine hydrolase, partial [Paraeggerthella sp.]|nr:serine hydrolase [Paraeggerthella sp.]